MPTMTVLVTSQFSSIHSLDPKRSYLYPLEYRLIVAVLFKKSNEFFSDWIQLFEVLFVEKYQIQITKSTPKS